MGDATLNEETRIFYRKLFKVGIPVLIQQVVSMCLNLADTIMVGKVSENALAAVGAANQIYFIFSVLLFGVFSGASVHTVQYWGIRDLVSLRKVLGIDYLMCFLLSVPAMLLAYCAAPQLITLFNDEPEVVALGTDYLRIVCFSFIFGGLTFVISYNSRAIMDLKIPTAINTGAIGLNIFLNYCLIYGKLGFPHLGVEGAAIATLIARVLECTLMLGTVYLRKQHPLKARLREMMSFSKEMYLRVMRTAVPVIFNEGGWALSVALVFAAYGKISAAALAIAQVTSTVTEFFQTVYYGVGNASAVIIGEELGKGKTALAFRYSKKIMKITWGLSACMTVLIILAREPIAAIYAFGPETTDMLMKSMLIYAIAMTPKMLAYMIVVGLLRAGGDTMYCMILEVVLNMGIQVPLAFFSVMVLHLPLNLAIAVVAISDFVKVVFCYQRYRSKKWMNVITEVEVQEGEEA